MFSHWINFLTLISVVRSDLALDDQRVKNMIRLLKILHGWLGIFVLPWVIIIGLTGIYLNHPVYFLGFFTPQIYDEAEFDAWPGPKPVDSEAAQRMAMSMYPDEKFILGGDNIYHGRDAHVLSGNKVRVIVAAASGHYWVKTQFRRKTFAPDGTLLHSKVYWASVFKFLHVRGWLGSAFGTWLADITAGAMVVFGFSGIFLFLTPRLRRRRNKKARVGDGRIAR